MNRIAVLIVFAPRLVAAEPVRHVPPASAPAAAPLELVAKAPPTAAITLHYRSTGETRYTVAELVRREPEWVAVVPATAIAGTGFEYYLATGSTAVFASAAAPHTIPVTLAESAHRRARDLAQISGRRSRIHASTEYVTFGTPRVDGVPIVDRYYRVDADFAYHLFAYPLQEVRVGYTRLIGETRVTREDGTVGTTDVGFKVAGWFELGLAPVEGIGLDARAMVMATAQGFAVGGRAELRLGVRDASHVALGAEHMADVGTSGFFRLGWGTVPRLPMAATVEVTNLPETDRDAGVRLFYDIATAVGANVRLGLRVGYAARLQTIAGLTGGLNATVAF